MRAVRRSPFLSLSFALLLLIDGVSPARAGSVSGSNPVQSTVAPSCVISSLDSLDLGNYQPLSSSPTAGQGQIALRCTKNTVASALPTQGGSQMTGSNGSLSYGLYVDAASNKIWGGTAYTSYTYATINYSLAYIYTYQADLTYQNSLAACQAFANGLGFAYNASTKGCAYNIGAPKTTTTVAYHSGNGGVYLYGASGSYSTVRTDNTAGSDYSAYIPSATSTKVGSTGIAYNEPVSGTGSGTPLTGTSTSVQTPLKLTYYAQIPAQQDVTPGTYVDTVVVSVTF